MSSRPPSNRRYQGLLALLATADAIWNASRRFFGRWDLGPSQFNILNLLGDEPEGLSQIDLGRRLIMHRSNVTGLVDRLEKRQWVERRSLAGDRRAYRVVLTPAGSRLLAEIYPHYRAAAEEAWQGLSAKEVDRVVTALARVVANTDRLATARKPDP